MDGFGMNFFGKNFQDMNYPATFPMKDSPLKGNIVSNVVYTPLHAPST